MADRPARREIPLQLLDPFETRIDSILCEGVLEVHGYLPRASNATFLATLHHQELQGLCVYKPRRGETPLWDFPAGTLWLRERAAWLVDAMLGWRLVPPTVLRDGPAGPGALQVFIGQDPDAGLDDVLEHDPEALMRLVVFDIVVNNADRKAGHCLVDASGHLWAIDHGVCFHVDDKLRTVIWEFQGEELPDALAADLQRLTGMLTDGSHPQAVELSDVLDGAEMGQVVERAGQLLNLGRFPAPGYGRRVPWPPW